MANLMQPTDIEIARTANLQSIAEVAQRLDIPSQALYHYGPYKAKLAPEFTESLQDRPEGKLILVTAITPTPAGEGKTTTTVGLGDALNQLGKKAAICLREPSLGPCFGIKGGATGGGYSQVVPMEDINLHFTGDIHAIGTAHNLLSALLDNHVNWGNRLDIDPRRITWRRVMDMNDRALRHIICSMGGLGNGYVREDGFDITVASEVMAIFCLAENLQDLRRRLSRIIVAYNHDKQPITAHALNADGAMTVLLKDAFMPNLVQTLENNLAFIHGGPFANIAHGCNSLIATRTALRLADYVVTEAGFGADLGAEKFFNIKCRKAGLRPNAAVVVTTVRALKMHGGVALKDLDKENIEAVHRGCANLARHVRNVKTFGVPTLVAINRFDTDTEAEINEISLAARWHGSEAFICSHWAEGSSGIQPLAERLVRLVDGGIDQFAPLYDDDVTLWDKVKTVATHIYEADDIIADKKIRVQFAELQKANFGHLPVCIAKTQYSFSTDPNLKNAPTHHVVPIRELRLAAGAEFLVVICGDIMTMPGLPRVPAAGMIGIDDNGMVTGLA